MSKVNGSDHLSVDELEQLLYRKKRAVRRKRLQRLKQAGRVVEVNGLDAPHDQPPPLERPKAIPTGSMRQFGWQEKGNGAAETGVSLQPADSTSTATVSKSRWLVNKALVLVEITAVLGFIFIVYTLWNTQNELNAELSEAQQAEVASIQLPTPSATPVIDLVVLPTGHRYIEGRSPEPVEAGDIPSHLLPALQAYTPPPIPTPGPEHARVIKIPAIGVNDPIVEGMYDWEQLKRGVAHHIGSANPGENGNMILAAHNDIFGEIFRDLDKLSPGDEITIETNLRSYTYVVTKLEVVDPTDVHVMDPTEHASATLISCYPYRINTQRIVVYADLVTGAAG